MLSLTYRTITGKTNSFILFPGSAESSVGLLRKTSLAMAYSGPYQVVQGIVDAFNVSINIFPIRVSCRLHCIYSPQTELGSLQCDGTSCPAPSNGTARMGRVTGKMLCLYFPCYIYNSIVACCRCGQIEHGIFECVQHANMPGSGQNLQMLGEHLL